MIRRLLLASLVALSTAHTQAADPPAKAAAVPVDFIIIDGESPCRLSVRAEIDGTPVSALWTDAFAKLFAYHDRNGDGSLDAKEAATLPSAKALRQAMTGGFTPPIDSAPEFSELDQNKDGKVSLGELTRYYKNAGLGNALFGVGRLPFTAELTKALVTQLDTDGDGLLSEKEWKAAVDTLRKLDKNDDELIGAGELSAKVVYPGAAGTQLLTPAAPSKQPLDLLAKLPLVMLPVDADPSQSPVESKPKSNAQEWRAKLSTATPSTDRFVFAGKTVRIEGWVSGGRLTEAIEASRKQLIAQFESPAAVDELAPRRAPLGLKWLVPIADRNGDGQLDRKELDAWLDLQTHLNRGHVFVTLLDGGGLFELIDTNHDGALSVRELRNAWATLTAAGVVRDGKCDLKTLPRVVLAVASPGYPQSIALANRRGPAWFIAMDRNSDGDVSRREFTGPAEVFNKLDLDGDGLLSPEEAALAKSMK